MAATPENNLYSEEIDLENCAREPIHIINRTQEFGLLLVADPESFSILQTGSNSREFLSHAPEALLGKEVGEVFGTGVTEKFRQQLKEGKNSATVELQLPQGNFLLTAHQDQGQLLLDLEPLTAFKEASRDPALLFADFRGQEGAEGLFSRTAKLVRQNFGYDRVMIYKFDEQWNGEVVAEEREAGMQSWFGLHYPASDIPAQSRAMFLKNRIRIISDVDYKPVPLLPERSPQNGGLVDISSSSLRAVSPIHIEYLKNMEVGASLTAAIEVRGKLWGLIACHHRSPRFLDLRQRESFLFLARLLAMELTVEKTDRILRTAEKTIEKRERLMQQVREASEVPQGLCEASVKFTELLESSGGALYINGSWSFAGSHPSAEELQELLDEYLIEQEETLLHTDALGKNFPKAEKYREIASGLLSLRLAANKYLLWFRPESLQRVEWGGDPSNKAFYNTREQRLSPRKSFEKYTELKRGTSLPWENSDLNAAKALGEGLSYEFLARQRNEIEALNLQLSEANQELQLFSYGLSHDLRAPVRGIEGLLDILLEDYAEGLNPQALEYLTTAQKLSTRLEVLIDDILTYSRMSHSQGLKMETFATEELIEEVRELNSLRTRYPHTRLEVQQELPPMRGDRNLLLQLWSNLLCNAYKYSGEAPHPLVEVGCCLQGERELFFVRDNGIGIAEKSLESIFEPFSRAVGSTYEGTGIGLALVRKIVEKHGGQIWAESEAGKGSVFYLYFPEINHL